ncbi:hypothetical protein [Catellatospora chokoriensis]|uniref:Uncharacterized protein n=1 Tax=Catellatospora chokoriensis TaxID=310353 RepID=A0A8J3NWT1_9ACTN|nr:hypothetical protein [Catellatospora chokoriensis]GIF93635.1 hypothetical protein Cch02nite_70790 [Catellatospora chokoriensis]
MIEALRATLDRHAAEVTPRPDPYPRVVSRHRRRRRRVTAAIAAVALVFVVAPGAWLFGRPQPYLPVAGPPPAALLPLLNSPTRGSLAGDNAYIESLRQLVAEDDTNSDGGSRLPDDPGLIKVLFVGDIGARRIAVVAGVDGKPLVAAYQGKPGDGADELSPTMLAELEPALGTGFAMDNGNAERTYLLLGPVGAVYETAETRYTGTGIQRNWTRLDAPDGYVGIADLVRQQRFRVLTGGTVLYETEGGAAAGPGSTVTVDPQPAAGRGRPMPAAATQIANSLATLTRLTGPDVTYRVLWSDEIDMPGTSTGRAAVVTVQAVTADGGGPYATGTIDTGEGYYRDHPSGYGIAGDVEHTLLAMRLPWYQVESDRLQIIAPPAAVRAEVVRDGQTAEATLVNGVGGLTVPLNSQLTIRVYDATGALLATLAYADRNEFGCDRFDPAACATGPAPSGTPTPTSAVTPTAVVTPTATR